MRAIDVLSEDENQAEFSGVVVRKGTIAAFLSNAKAWSNVDNPARMRQRAEQDIIDAIPSLRAIELFDVLSIRDSALAALVAKY